MLGGIIFAVVMILVVPVGIMFAGAMWSALFGWLSSQQPEGQQTSE